MEWPDAKIQLRFFHNVNVTDGHTEDHWIYWPERSHAAQTGYRFISTPSGLIPAHRYAYEFFIGPIPDGFHCHHECRNPECVNPAHLRAVPKSDHPEITARNRRLQLPDPRTPLQIERDERYLVEFRRLHKLPDGWRWPKERGYY